MTPFLAQLAARGCITAPPDTDLHDITSLMATHKIGTVVICKDAAHEDEMKEIVGIISERDIIRILANEGTIHKLTAADIMLREFFFIAPDVNSTKIMELMSEHHIRHLPIVHDKKLVGIVSMTDVIRRLSEKTQEEAAYLREFINS